MSGVIAAVGVAATVASTAFSIIGSGQQASAQANAQRAQGEQAYQNALLRNQQLERQAAEMRNQAVQRDNQAILIHQRAQQERQGVQLRLNEAAMLDNQAATEASKASDQQAAAQRDMLEKKRMSRIAAGRARAVMAGSGAGVDEGLIASILGEGDYAGAVSMYEGDARAQTTREGAKFTTYRAGMGRYEAARAAYGADVSDYEGNATTYQADLDRSSADNLLWQGRTGLAQAGASQGRYNAAASASESAGTYSMIKGGLTLASRYAPAAAGLFSGSGGSPTTGSDTDPNLAPLRTGSGYDNLAVV